MQEMSQTDLKEIQAVTLTMSKYFVQFCQEIIYYVISVAVVVLVLYAVKDLFRGMMIWTFFMPRPDYEKLKKLWPQKAD